MEISDVIIVSISIIVGYCLGISYRSYTEEIIKEVNLYSAGSDRSAFSGKHLLIKRTYKSGASKIIEKTIWY